MAGVKRRCYLVHPMHGGQRVPTALGPLPHPVPLSARGTTTGPPCLFAKDNPRTLPVCAQSWKHLGIPIPAGDSPEPMAAGGGV